MIMNVAECISDIVWRHGVRDSKCSYYLGRDYVTNLHPTQL